MRTMFQASRRLALRRSPQHAIRFQHAAASLAAAWDRPFPSILISENQVSAQGSFAEAQATYLKPDPAIVRDLDAIVRAKKMGIVAHFYMDPELQGILASLQSPHVCIADSLVMGEAAAKMVAQGAQSIAVLGVDFMSESVRANLDSNGFTDIPVYRLSQKKIGCSLAESAERTAYAAFLKKAAKTPRSLHVVYINTSLRSKAFAHDTIPTITCTSSNVVQTVLQAFAQIPDLHVWYGPDTYMGSNLRDMFERIQEFSDERIKKLHPQHNRKTIAELLTRFEFFQEGNCVVHHLFGDKVTERVRAEYADAFKTAHLEVPGEMFTLAMEAQNEGRGVVGSTSNILTFITDKTKEAIKQSDSKVLRFVLGTEAGMITAIVRGVQKTLKEAPSKGAKKPQVEIIFPVAADAVATEGDTLVPGVRGGEGCSTAGGCATCPFMKMNDIDALFAIARDATPSRKQSPSDPLAPFYPQKYTETISGHSISSIGVHPILHMKYLMEHGQLSDALVQDIVTRKPESGCPESHK